MGLAHEKKSYLQEKANLFEIGSKKTINASSNRRKNDNFKDGWDGSVSI